MRNIYSANLHGIRRKAQKSSGRALFNFMLNAKNMGNYVNRIKVSVKLFSHKGNMPHCYFLKPPVAESPEVEAVEEVDAVVEVVDVDEVVVGG
jgi:hypothetical protein